MARANNFLLGNGERLTSRVAVPAGGGDKNPPYTFEGARKRIATRLQGATAAFDALPRGSTPDDEVVAVVTLHPRYVSKSDFPLDLLSAVGLRAIGSRSRVVAPESWGVEKHPVAALTEELFVAGKRETFRRWSTSLDGWNIHTRGARELPQIEDLNAFEARDKLRGMPAEKERAGILEVVLHNGGSRRVIDAFLGYAREHGARPIANRQRDVRGLTFIPVETQFDRAEELAQFSFLRVARPLPTLRPFPPGIARTVGSLALKLPSGGPLSGSFRALVFDGGLPGDAPTVLKPWVNYIEPAGIGSPAPWMQDHGLAVTAALLFGPIRTPGVLPLPVCGIDHVRVTDMHTNGGRDLDYVDVLDRILAFLDSNVGRYEYINLSIGPKMAAVDDEVTAWTASLDDRLAFGRALATVAAGNDGHLDSATGLNRIQPPADGVNVVAVGASDRSGPQWQRATYSCTGPGRSPGYVKPDGLAFGGSEAEPFICLAARPQIVPDGTAGTSLSAPVALRSAVAVRAQLGQALSPLAVRGLLIHRADPGPHGKADVGWGRFEEDPERLITCDDDEALVVYQGTLPVGEHLRAPIPMPSGSLAGIFFLTVTLVIAPEVDPEHPGAYTRSGLEVMFRPNSKRYRIDPKGNRSRHPKTKPFFSMSNLYGAAEYTLREEGHKWEPCLRNSQKFRASTLDKPCFDIYYHHRQGASAAPTAQPIPYALIVGIRAPRVKDLYNRVVKTYTNVLIPLQPQLRIPVRR
jgi:hypothetical protein